MARLVIPSKSSSPATKSFLGLFSSFNFQNIHRHYSPRYPSKSYYRNSSTCEKVIYRRGNPFPVFLTRNHISSKRLTCSVATQPLPHQREDTNMDAPTEIFLKDYKMPDYYFNTVYLEFALGEDKTNVSSKIHVLPRVEGFSCPLVLNGHDLKLLSIKVDGKDLKEEDYHLSLRHLTLPSPPTSAFTLEIVTEIYPQSNTSLEGLYKSSGNFCTQCEVEGFRKITFYQDRPDIMAKYTCCIEGDITLYPILLSNGNLLEQGDLEGGKHYEAFNNRLMQIEHRLSQTTPSPPSS